MSLQDRLDAIAEIIEAAQEPQRLVRSSAFGVELITKIYKLAKGGRV